MRRRSKSRKEKRVVQRLAAAMRKLSLHNGPVGVTQEAEGSSNTARTMPRAFVKRPLQRSIASRAKAETTMASCCSQRCSLTKRRFRSEQLRCRSRS